MNESRFREITSRYPGLRLAILGDFCLDRYLEIDPARSEVSIETGLEVFNVVKVRSQPGAAGTILNNLVALGIGEITPVGFCGEDGEGWELRAALSARAGVRLDHFLQTPLRRTFTYCKPLVLQNSQPPRELNRFDSKNWSPTPDVVQESLAGSFRTVSEKVDAVILMDQADLAETGVVTKLLLEAVRQKAESNHDLLMMGDSRRSLKSWPPVCLKMNHAEFTDLAGRDAAATPVHLQEAAVRLAREKGRAVFITLAERGIIGAGADGSVHHRPAIPVRGAIDIVGAGDAVTANLTAALAAGATLPEALELAMIAASIVIHQLGTTGTATIADLHAALFGRLRQ